MSKKQKRVILGGAMLIVLMGLVPPWKYIRVLGEGNYTERPGGYGLIMVPPIGTDHLQIAKTRWRENNWLGDMLSRPPAIDLSLSKELAEIKGKISPQRFYFDKDFQACGARVDTTRLLIQWFIVAIATGALILFLKDEKPPIQDRDG
ncbi:MAG: hypothetical protein NT039_04860 [Candidatus Berkelbacteria bacterium]|nr:hypothetical protein [Candidatus Berkelbacteria bacterium]